MRRNWKRILSLLLTVAMVFTMNTGVFAGTTYKVTATDADGNVTTKYVNADGSDAGDDYDAAENVEEYSKEKALEAVKEKVKADKSTDNLDNYEKSVWDAFAADNADEAAELLKKEESGEGGENSDTNTQDPDGTPETQEPEETAKGDEPAPEAAAIDVKYIIVTKEKEIYIDENNKEVEADEENKVTLNKDSAIKTIDIKEINYRIEKNGENTYYGFEQEEIEGEKFYKEVSLQSDLTDNEVGLANKYIEKKESDVSTQNDKPNDKANGIGWSLVKDVENGTEEISDVLKFNYDESTTPYTLNIDATLMSEGYYLQALAGAKPVKIAVIKDMDNDSTATTVGVGGYTVSLSGIVNTNGEGTGEAVEIETVGDTTISLSNNGTKVFEYKETSGSTKAEYADAEETGLRNKEDGTVGSAPKKSSELIDSGFKKLYLVNPAKDTELGTVSFNDATDFPNSNVFDTENTVVYGDSNYIAMSYDDTVVTTTNNNITKTSDGTNIPRIKIPATDSDTVTKHYVYGFKEQDGKVTVKTQTVIGLSANGITAGNIGENQVELGASLVDSDKSGSIKVSYNALEKKGYGASHYAMVNDLQLSLVSWNGNFDAGNYFIQEPKAGENKNQVGKDDATLTFSNLVGNTKYIPIIRTVSAASSKYINDDILYIPSKWIPASSGTLGEGADGVNYVRTKPNTESVVFESVSVTNIGTSTASVNVTVKADTDAFMIAGIYISDSQSAPDKSTSKNAINGGNKWIISSNNLNAKGNWVEITDDAAVRQAVAGQAKMNKRTEFVFSVSSDNGLEPGKTYYVYTMGYLKTDGRTDMLEENLYVSSKPAVTFSTVAEYSLSMEVNEKYEGGNFDFDGKTVTVGAYYGNETDAATGMPWNENDTHAKNAFYNLNPETGKFTFTVVNSAGKKVVIDKTQYESIKGGKAYDGIDTAFLKKLLLIRNIGSADADDTKWNLPEWSAIESALSGTAGGYVTRTLEKSNDYSIDLDPGTWNGDVKGTADDPRIVSGDDVGKTGYKLHININEGGADGNGTLYPSPVSAVDYNVTIVNTNLYVYPNFIFGKYVEDENGNVVGTVSDGSISADGIRFSVGHSSDTETPSKYFSDKYVRVAGKDAISAFRIVRVDSKGNETVIQTFTKTSFDKGNISIPEGEYRLQITDAKPLASLLGDTWTGYNFTLAEAGDYTNVTVEDVNDQFPELGSSTGFVPDYKDGALPYFKITVDPTGKGDVIFTIARDTSVPVAYGTVSANDTVEKYLRSAFKATLVNSTNKNYNYMDRETLSDVKVKFVEKEADAKSVVTAASENKLKTFSELTDISDKAQAGDTVYAVMLVDVDGSTGVFTKYFNVQAAYTSFQIEKRAVGLSWNGGVAQSKSPRYTSGAGSTITEIGRGDTDTFKKGFSISGNELSYFDIYALDSEGKFIGAGNNAAYAAGTSPYGVQVNGTTFEYVNPDIFNDYNFTSYGRPTNWALPGDKGMTAASSAKFAVDTSTVNINKTAEYNVKLKNAPTLSTNAISYTTSGSTKTRKSFGTNFTIDGYNIVMEIKPRTTITFQATFGKNTVNSKYEVESVGDGKVTSVTFASDVEAEAKKLMGTFYGTSPSANVIDVTTGIGAGKISAYNKTHYNNAPDGETTNIGKTVKVNVTGDDYNTAFGSIKIVEDEDLVIQAVITTSITPEVTTYNVGEHIIEVTTIEPVTYDGRAHVVSDTVLKYNLTSKVNDVYVSLKAKYNGDNDSSSAESSYDLVLNKDYKATYKNNVNANVKYDANGNMTIDSSKQPQVIITGINSYKGLKLTLNFNIVANDLTSDTDISKGEIRTVIGGTGTNGTANETKDDDIIVTSEYVRLKSDTKGMKLSSKFQITREFTSGEGGKTKTKKATLKKTDYTANVYKVNEDNSETYVGALASALVTNTKTNDEPQEYKIKVTGIGNYQGEIEKKVYVFKKSSTKLLDNAKPAWGKLNKISYADKTTIESIVPSVTTKDKKTYKATAGGSSAGTNGTNVYRLEITNKDTGELVYTTVADEDVTNAADDTDTNDEDYEVSDLDKWAGKTGVHLLPGKYTAKIVAYGTGDTAVTETLADGSTLPVLYGESKAKSFTVKAVKLPAITFNAYKVQEKYSNGTAVIGWYNGTTFDVDSNYVTKADLTKAEAETNSKGKAINEKNRTLDYTGYDTYLDIKVGGDAYPRGKFFYIPDTDGDPTDSVISMEPGKYTLTVKGMRQFKGQTKKIVLTRKAMTMKTAIKDYGLGIVAVGKPEQNINGAIFRQNLDEDNPTSTTVANFDSSTDFYLTLTDGEVISANWVSTATDATTGLDTGKLGTQQFTYIPNYNNNTAILIFDHVISQNEARKGMELSGVLQLKFSKNTTAGSKAKVTVTGLSKYPSWYTATGATGSFITGSKLDTNYTITQATITGKVDAAGNANIEKYDAIKVATGEQTIEAGNFYYTVEDVAYNAKKEAAGTYAPKFNIYQAQQGVDANTDKVILNTKKKLAVKKDYNVTFTVSSDIAYIHGLKATITAGNSGNYKVAEDATANGTKEQYQIDGIYIYDKAVKLPKDGITLQLTAKPKGTELTNDNVRWLFPDEKGKLTYTYDGLNVDIGGSLKSLKLSAGKDENVTIVKGDTSATYNGDVKDAVEVIDLKPNGTAQTEGNYTATVRIRPDVVASGRSTTGTQTAGTQYGGTIKIKFTVRNMSKDPDVNVAL